jgi:acyl transferase domain-containing protein/NAD(P)-dependent dehydrogenase (short-subunit alcohol dehydrogenase family)
MLTTILQKAHLYATDWFSVSGAAPSRREVLLIGDLGCDGFGAVPVDVITAQGPHDMALGCMLWFQSRTRRVEESGFIQIVTTDPSFGEALVGLMRSVVAESPQIGGQVVIVRPDVGPALPGLLAQCGNGDLLDCRDTPKRRRFVPLTSDDAPVWRDQSLYIITGGAGGLGRIFARDIARSSTRSAVLLVGRTAADGSIASWLNDLRGAGLAAEYARCDVTDPAALALAIAPMRTRFGPVRGVLHAAGVLRDGLLLNKRIETAADVLRAKYDGIVALDSVTADDPLSFFVGFSSLAAVVGSEGQADYAMANGLLDAFIAERARMVRQGLRHGRCLSLNWPFWADGGMDVHEDKLRVLAVDHGLEPMTTPKGLAAFRGAMASEATQVIVACGENGKIAALLNEAPRPDFRVELTERAAAAAWPNLAGDVAASLKGLFAQVVKRSEAEIDFEEPFAFYGVDSLMVVEISHRLKPIFGDLPRALMFEHRSVRALADYLWKTYPQDCAAWVGRTLTAKRSLEPARPRVSRAETPTAGPLAVIGMSGCFPDAPDIDTFWDNLRAGRNAITEIPCNRWPVEGFFEPDRKAAVAQGKSYSKWGGFLDGFATFDPLFFNIAPRDALEMDPQERLFLQAAWWALEDAGLTRADLSRLYKGRVGVFVGVTKSDHTRLGSLQYADGSISHARSSFSSIANRVSFFLDLSGPSIPVDTMCSSSLTALHMACEALARGSCDLALVGGVNLYQHPSSYAELCRSEMLAQDGRCRSFGAGGNGFVPGEGVGCLVLTRLDVAEQDMRRIDALIRTSTINHGGAANGYTVPNPAAQRALIRLLLDRAEVDARSISYVEAHGTGTSLGDPIEIESLTGAFAQDTKDRSFCGIGSVKSNIGHLEAAAGIAGIIKTVLQMRHQYQAPSLNADELNPNIDFGATPFQLIRTGREWRESADAPLRAIVSSFGAGGSNAAVLVESARRPVTVPSSPGPHVAVLSGSTAAALDRQIACLLDWLNRQPSAAESLDTLRQTVAHRLGVPLEDVPLDTPLAELGLDASDLRYIGHVSGVHPISSVQSLLEMGLNPMAPGLRSADLAALCQTLQTGRESFAHRVVFIVSSLEDLASALRGWAQGVRPQHIGEVATRREDLTALSGNSDVAHAVDELLLARDLNRLAGLWVQGFPIDWSQLHAKGRRPPVSMPGYVFEKRWLWLGDLDKAKRAPVTLPVAELRYPPAACAIPGTQTSDKCTILRAILARVIDLDPEEIDDARPFAEYGLDSILAVRFVDALNDRFSLGLKTTAIFDHASIKRLALLIESEESSAPLLQRAKLEPNSLLELESYSSARVPAVPTSDDDRIAVIGMSGRFPGAPDLDTLWHKLETGAELIGSVSRWPLPDSVVCRRGGFLDAIDQFDALFFNISGAEAVYMDPQQRVFLEESWLALESSGYAGDAVAGHNCGVYVGCCSGDYKDLFLTSPSSQSLWGNMASLIPARIAYYLDLKGPALAIDTACSSSLVAIHSACSALRLGETDMALAGGVFIQATPTLYLSASKAGMLSPTGRCYSFDTRADGFVPGEGAAVLVLKRLADALADGDVIHGIIEGSAINHDGATNGITAPSAVSQATLLRRLYDGLAISPAEIGFLETHGTGTQLGDLIEFEALNNVFGRQGNESCALGSIKTNIGHAQFAAGVAGVGKILLSLKRERIPGNLNFETANPTIALVDSPFYVPARSKEWPRGTKPRYGAVSSFGASGTNAHVVIGEAPRSVSGMYLDTVQMVAISARSETALRTQIERLIAHCERYPETELGDIAFTLLAGRKHFEHRLALVVDKTSEMIAGLRAWLQGEPGECLFLGVCHRKISVEPTSYDDPTRVALAQAFVVGGSPDVVRVYADSRPQRTVLPGYPFERRSYWVEHARLAERDPLFTIIAEGGGHYGVTLAQDSALITNHHVGGIEVLPGLAIPEMARRAYAEETKARDSAVSIRDLTWLRPIKRKTLGGLHLVLRQEGQGYEFVVMSAETRYAQGWIGPASTAVSPTDAAAYIGDGEDVPVETCYARLRAQGVDHGPHLRAIAQIRREDACLNVSLRRTDGTVAPLDPVMLDAAVQGSVLFGDDETPATVPFAIQEIVMHAPCSTHMLASLTEPRAGHDRSLHGLDVNLFDATGRLAVQLCGVSARPLEHSKPIERFYPAWSNITLSPARSTAPPDVVFGATPERMEKLCSQWPGVRLLESSEAASVAEIGPFESILYVAEECAPISAPAQLSAVARAHANEALRLITSVIACGGESRAIRWTVATSGALVTGWGEQAQATAAALPGIFGSLAREYPHWSVRIADLEMETNWPLADLLALHAEQLDVPGALFTRRGNLWLRPCLQRFTTSPGDNSGYRPGAVYVVVGGAGGVGRTWSEDVVRRAGAQVVWIGRSAQSDAISAHQDAIARHGLRPHYISADARDTEALCRARTEILDRFGRIDGVVHSVITLSDVTLARMKQDELEAVLSAKIDTTVQTLDCFAADATDFFLFFSSIQSFARMPGQGNYAAGCTFADNFARQAGARRGLHVRVVNWGYWDQTGIVADETYRARMAHTGLVGLDPRGAMDAVEGLIAGGVEQLAIVALRAGGTLTMQDRQWEIIDAPEVCPPMRDAVQLAEQTEAVTVITADVGRQMSGLDAEMSDILAAVLAQIGLMGTKGPRAVQAPAGAPAIYDRWMGETARVLRRAGYLDDAFSPIPSHAPLNLAEAWSRWDKAVAPLRGNPNLGDHVRLAEAMLRALPRILSGTVPAVDIMFPGGTLDLVSGIYSGNQVADYFNATLCDVLERAVQARIAVDPAVELRVIEIGAGTGSTAKRVFDRLWPYRDNIAEYLYSDLSRAFMIHAKQSFSARAPYLRTAIFDVTKPLDGQDPKIGHYDIAIASNVLHATPGILTSLRNVKATLKRNGLILLNELIENVLFSHVTFGLLDGWWAYADADLRIEGSPMLSPETWAAALRAEGFSSVSFPTEEGRVLSQQIIVAESDGLIVKPAEDLPFPAACQPILHDSALPTSGASDPNHPRIEGAATMDLSELRARGRSLIRGRIAEAIDVGVDLIGDEAPLARFGVDSILVLQIVAEMRRDFPEVSSALLFDLDSVAALTEHFLETAPAQLVAAVTANGLIPPSVEVTQALPLSSNTPTKLESFAKTPQTLSSETGSPVPSHSRDIAIIGLSGRYPGARNIRALWENLLVGADSVTDRPTDGRGWAKWPHLSPMPAGYLQGVDLFDPLFFRISPAEAERMDPQERLLVQEAYAAIEEAGYAPEEFGSTGRVGVFVGVMNAHYATRAAFWSAANRISHLLDLTGPSLAVDTACSSSLTAIHLAVESLRNGRCEAALVGGVNVISNPRHIRTLMDLGMISPTGRARAFGAGADGMVAGEGVGVLLLRPLEQALADGDHIHGIIAGTAINAGGRTRSYTAPSPKAHAAVIREALRDADVSGTAISAIEAHGTGTPLGDPIEAAGLIRALEGAKGCSLGSLKSNIGHCESAAGIAGVTKMLLQIAHRKLVPSLHIDSLNTEVDLGSGILCLQTRVEDWTPPSGHARLGGVSSFGAGGANAHVILREADVKRTPRPMPTGQQLIVLSAQTADRLLARARDLLSHLDTVGPLDAAAFADIAFTLQTGRKAMAERLALAVPDAGALRDALGRFVAHDAAAIPDLRRASLREEEAMVPDEGLSPVLESWALRDELGRIADLWLRGISIHWPALWTKWSPRRVSLPTYPFAEESYWIEEAGDGAAQPALSKAAQALPQEPVPVFSSTVEQSVDGLLAELVAQILKLPVDRIDPDAPLETYGLDSVMILRLTALLEEHFGPLPKTLFYEYRSLRELATYALKGHAIKAAQTSSSYSDPLASVAAHASAPKDEGDIAIIGLAGRYPLAPDLPTFWKNLMEGRDCVTEIPAERWCHTPYFSSERATGKTRSRWGGFVEGVDAFDAPFFGMLPADAELSDPQERLFVETVYHAMQDAGHTRKSLSLRGPVGVFVGVMYEEYQFLGVEETLRGRPTALSGSPASIANRVSYLFDFRGPSLALDSMCSSSLTALHLAMRALRSGECAVAVAGGVNLNLHPNKYLMLGRGGFESSNGRCASFAADADGYVPSEGVGAALLKPLAQALADGDPIWGVLKGSALNHGGRTNGYTVPDPAAQADVVRAARADARVDAASLSYIEAHGTGTSLGDPIEVAGLTRALEGLRSCALGSVKSNIGHCESAAGIAGLTKVLLQMRHRTLVPSIHAETLNPHLRIEETPFRVQQRAASWRPATPGPLRAGVSSFGAGGANAHIIVEEAPERRALSERSAPVALILSARTQAQLPQMALALAECIEESEDRLCDVAYTLQCGREALAQRMGFVVADRESASAALRAFAQTGQAPPCLEAPILSSMVARWRAGENVDWEALYELDTKRVHLPLYPFEQHVYWGAPRPASEVLFGSTEEAEASVEDNIQTSVTQFEPVWIPTSARGSISSPRCPVILTIGMGQISAHDGLEVVTVAPELPARFGDVERIAVRLCSIVRPMLQAVEMPDLVQFAMPGQADASLFAAIAGFAGSLSQEVPGLRTQTIRLPGEFDIPLLTMDSQTGDDVICHAEGTRRVRRIAQVSGSDRSAHAPWREKGVYIISGGAGGIGRIIAQEIAEKARGSSVILLGRSSAGTDITSFVAQLNDHGIRAEYHSIDIANAPQLAQLVARVRSKHGPISGVIHSAGLLQDGYLLRKRESNVQTVVRAKVTGAQALDDATATEPLEFFLCFSSIAGLTGNAGQADYAFSNGWIDGFASERAARVLRGERTGRSLSINWPLWSKGGMSISEAAQSAMRDRFGLTAMPTARGLDALATALASDAPQRVVAHGMADRIAMTLAGGAVDLKALFSESVVAEKPRVDIVRVLSKVVADVLRIGVDSVSADQPLADYGFDSISLIDLADRCSAVLPVLVTPDIFFSFGTLEQVAAHLAIGWPKDDEQKTFSGSIEVTPMATLASANEVDPIAIVGISANFPGADTIEQFWSNLVSARDVIGEVPPDRWDWQEIYGDPKTEPGCTNVKWGGFIDGLADFDPVFFKISPRDAEVMDPHQRLLMTHVWKAIEDAGESPDKLSGRNVAIFMATGPSDYATIAARQGIIIQERSPTAMVGSIAPNRISALLNLHGPSEPVETACSSALVALHRGVEAIRNGCESAIIGAVNTILTPYAHISFARSGMLSPDGRCKAFSADANGYVRSEGAAAVMLKPLSQAEKDGNPILGVIRATGVNHGGRGVSLFAPNAAAQSALIESVIEKSGVDPRSITAIEAHGTGTPVGDPVEFEGLRQSFGNLYRKAGVDFTDNYCALSSVKTHVGHLEMAAGMTSLFKVLLQFRHRTLIANRHSEKVSPQISLQGTPFFIVDQNQPWHAVHDEHGSPLPRRAGINSFGFGGVNAHVVLEEYVPPKRSAEPPLTEPEVIALSAKRARGLIMGGNALRKWIAARTEQGLDETLLLRDMAFTLQEGRAAYRHRLAFTAHSLAEVIGKLDSWLKGDASEDTHSNAVVRADQRQPNGVHATAVAENTAGGDLNRQALCEAWVQGATCDWSSLMSGQSRRRISLPGSAMNLTRHWVLDALEAKETAAGYADPGVGAVRPMEAKAAVRLLGSPERYDTGWRFPVAFGPEALFLQDHVVQGQAVMPASALLEMGLEAISELRSSVDMQLQRVSFERIVTADTVRDGVHVEVEANEQGFDFTIVSNVGAARIVHSRGHCRHRMPRQSRLPLDEMRTKVALRRVPGTEFYDRFAAIGMQYGPSHAGIVEAYVDKNISLALIQQPIKDPAQYQAYILPPNIVDAALQSTLGLSIAKAETEDRTSVPVLLEEINVYDSIPDQVWAVAQLRPQNGRSICDISLCDEEGTVLAELLGFLTAPLPVRSHDTRLLVPRWSKLRDAPEQVPDRRASVIVADGFVGLDSGSDFRGLEILISPPGATPQRRLGDVLETAMSLLAKLSQKQGGADYLLQILTPDEPATGEEAGLTAVAGFVRTAVAELPHVRAQLIACPADAPAEVLRNALAQAAQHSSETVLRLEEGTLFARRVAHIDGAQAESPWRDDGVYLITGGAGALGAIFASEIVRRTASSVLILTGRSPLGTTQERVLSELRALGAQAEYHSCDVTRAVDVADLCRDIQARYGTLTGVVHAAGVTDDGWLVDKTAASVTTILAPKVEGALALDEATRDMPLEIFLCFSSVSAEFGNQGQADYAVANAFLDRFAVARNQRRRAGLCNGRTLSINWTLWAGQGMGVSPSVLRLFQSRFGIKPMTPHAGLAALDRAWASGADQVIVLCGDAARMDAWLPLAGADPAPSPRLEDDDVQASLTAIVAKLTKLGEDEVWPDLALSEFGLDSIQFTELAGLLHASFGINVSPTDFYSMPTLAEIAAHIVAQRSTGLLEVKPEDSGLAPRSIPLNGSEPPITLSPAATAPSHRLEDDDVQASLTAIVAKLTKLGEDEIWPDLALSEFGLDSIQFTEFSGLLHASFGIDVSPTDFYSMPTLAEIAAHIVAQRPTGLLEAKPEAPVPNAVLPALTLAESAVQQIQHDAECVLQEGYAIIGVTAQLPGSPDLDAFWQNLMEGRDAITRPPLERWDWRAIDGDPRVEKGRTNVHWGGFIDRLDQFDAGFFGISAGEAEVMDPQQRLIMMHVWALLEASGYAPGRLAGSNTGLFVGISSSNSYAKLVAEAGRDSDPRWVTGNVPSVAVNRISNMLDLRGPSEPIETACSSSLVAIHRAIECLRVGDCDLVLAGGVNAMPNADLHVAFAAGGMLSPEGRCRSFATGANGYARAEGVGFVAIKRLVDATRDGDNILGVIRSSIVRHAGRAASLTAPNPASQAALVAEAYRRATIDPRTVTFIEAHGTGTALGDPIEIDGLKSAFGQLYTEHSAPAATEPHCWIGAVKSHIGHLETAAGIAGLVKILLQMQHGTLIGNLHMGEVNPLVKLEGSPFRLIDRNKPWSRLRDHHGGEIPRRAGLSSFGFGGVNAHLVLEEYRSLPPASTPEGKVAILLSAATEERLNVVVQSLLDWMRKQRGKDTAVLLQQVAHTLQVGRDVMKSRMGFVASSWDELEQRLLAYASGDRSDRWLSQSSEADGGFLGRAFDPAEVTSLVSDWAARGDISKAVLAWASGVPIDWESFRNGPAPHRIPLPTYPYHLERYWVSQKRTTAPAVLKKSASVVAEAPEGDIPELVRAIVADFLAVPMTSVELDASFRELGLDSIGVLTIASRVAAAVPALEKAGQSRRVLEAQSPRAICALVGEVTAEPMDKPEPAVPPSLPQPEGVADIEATRLDMSAGLLKSDPANLVIGRMRLTNQVPSCALGDLLVDETHPFFFDHPIDHISGIHLCEAMCQLSRMAHLYRRQIRGREPLHLQRALFTFHKVCSKDNPAQVCAKLIRDGSEAEYHAYVQQSGQVVAEANLVFSETTPLSGADHPTIAAGRRVDRRWVNKRDRRNTLLAGVATNENGVTARLSIDPQAAFFNDFPGDGIDGIVLAEAARQFMRVVMHLTPKPLPGQSQGSLIGLLKHIEFDLDRPIARGVPVEFRCKHAIPIELGGASFFKVEGQMLSCTTGKVMGGFSTSALSVSQELKDTWSTQRNE